ncbi:MAG: hypothetical protein GY849_05695 [Deltaproteobacteria bacterium]|nr:hypothetical protein [Deltaproteobacteria bacterium]
MKLIGQHFLISRHRDTEATGKTFASDRIMQLRVFASQVIFDQERIFYKEFVFLKNQQKKRIVVIFFLGILHVFLEITVRSGTKISAFLRPIKIAPARCPHI